MNPATLSLTSLPSLTFDDRGSLPTISAIYLVLDASNKVLYVGRSVNLRQRWQSDQHHRYSQLKDVDGCRIHWIECDRILLDEMEAALIEWFDPPLNGRSSIESQTENMRKISISLPDDQYEVLKQIAEEKSRSVSAQIQHILKKAGIVPGAKTAEQSH